MPNRKHAPDFELKNMAGRARRLYEALRDGPVVLVFFHSECPTCEFALPFVQRIHAGAAGGAQIWGISQDDVETTGSFARQVGLEFAILIDEEPYDVSSAYGIEFVPALYVVDPDGGIVWSDEGFSREAWNRVAAAVGSLPLVWEEHVPMRRPGCRSKN